MQGGFPFKGWRLDTTGKEKGTLCAGASWVVQQFGVQSARAWGCSCGNAEGSGQQHFDSAAQSLTGDHPGPRLRPHPRRSSPAPRCSWLAR